MLPSNNKTLFGEWSTERTVLVVVWRSTILLISLGGNITILVVVTKHRVINLGPVITTFIGHLAVSDLGVTFFGIAPVLSFSLVPDVSVNDLLCTAVCFTISVFISGSVLLVCALQVCKLATLKFPLRSRTWTAGFAHTVVGISWTWCCFSVLSYMELDGETVYFDYRIKTCMMTTVSAKMKWFRVAGLFVGIGLPGLLVVVSTFWLLKIAQTQARAHHRNSLQFQSAVTAVAIATAYCLSYLPFFIYLTVSHFTVHYKQFTRLKLKDRHQLVLVEYDRSGEAMTGIFYNDFFLIACLFTFLNTGSNFFIYLASITSFRQFVVRKLYAAIGRDQPVPLSARQGLLARRRGQIREGTVSFSGVLDLEVFSRTSSRRDELSFGGMSRIREGTIIANISP